MVKVTIKGPLKRSLGLKDFEIEGGKIEDVLKQLSEKLGVEVKKVNESFYIYTKIGGRDVKFRITLFFNGKNIINYDGEFTSGKMEIITPMGGG